MNGVVDALTVQGLRKTFGPTVAADDVSFSLPAGSSVGLVGESGSGKSTIARILVGLERSDHGTVDIAGAPPPASAGRQARLSRTKQIQMVFQDPFLSLDPRIRVRDSIVEVLGLHTSRTKAERLRRAGQLLDQVGLGAREADALPSHLSGGQRQRVAIARALAIEPRVLILDEATSALDVSIQAQILRLLTEIREQTGVTLLFVSHDLALMNRVTDRLIVLYRGRVVEQGHTQDLLTNPQHPYTRLLLESVPRPGWDPGNIAKMRKALDLG